MEMDARQCCPESTLSELNKRACSLLPYVDDSEIV